VPLSVAVITMAECFVVTQIQFEIDK